MFKNIYFPNPAKIDKIINETPDVKTLKLIFSDDKLRETFIYKPGQFCEFTVFGIGEATFCLASSPTKKGYIECSIKKMGKVTSAVYQLEQGDFVGIRGPYGNGFPVDELKNKNLIFVGGGIGLAPLRSLIWYVIDNRKDYKNVTIIYGARTVADLVYKNELDELGKSTNLILTVDPGGETKDWKGKIGLIPKILEEVNPSRENAVVITCGPPIMIRYTLISLDKLGFLPENIITTLERHMQCGIGKCGHCMIGNKYVCKDGPVFTYAQIKEFSEEV